MITARHAILSLFASLVLGLFGLLASAPAHAHFILQTPANWMSQDSLGSPQKGPPCGNEGGGTVTNMVTAYAVGATVTITIDEKIFHPGHYRVALATTDRSQLPTEPIVTPGAQDCGTAAVQDPPVFPVLADNVLVHTTAFTAPQTITVKLPANVTCTKCTLQVIEFMSDHALNVPGGRFYHHCADISIGAQSMSLDAGNVDPAPVDLGTPAPSSGCSFGASTAVPSCFALVLLALAWASLRRRA